jgi:hypothetical protein
MPEVLSPVSLEKQDRLDLKTLGPLVWRRKEQLGHTVEETSRTIGICKAVLQLWKLAARPPHLQLIPKIVEYLGYDPFGPPRSFGESLCFARLRLGLSRERAAKHLGIGTKTYERWEDGRITQVHSRPRQLLEEFLKNGIPARP